ncbi:GNAT family N-acetyltransferase [Cupriavidus campinensis]
MITTHLESFSAILPELKPLLPLHYEELALDKDKVPLDPQYDIYLERDRRGELMFMAVRQDGALIGYFIGFVAPGLHYRTCLTLTMDIFYIVPEHRGNKAGLVLFEAVKKEAKRRGVQRWFMGNKTHAKVHADALFKAIGAEEVETYYSIWLGE